MSVPGWSTVDTWLGRMGPGTAPLNKYHFSKWMVWLGEHGGDFASFTPDQLIEYQTEASGRGRYAILDLVQQYVLKTLQGQRQRSKEKAYSTIRSFFLHNRAELPRDPSFTIRGDIEKVVGNLSPQEVRRIALGSKKVYRAIFLCMGQGFMDEAAFEYWNINGWPKLQEDLVRPQNPNEEEYKKLIRIDQPGRKGARNERPYYTFIGSDAQEALRSWVKVRPRESKAIFIDQFKGPISKSSVKAYWDRKLVGLGIIEPRKGKLVRNADVRYGKNPHEMRDTFRSLWEKSPSNKSLAEFMMGHVVDPLGYNKAFNDEEWARKEYMLATPWLNIISSGRAFGDVSEDELGKLSRENEGLRKQMETMKIEADLRYQSMMNETTNEIKAFEKRNDEMRLRIQQLEAQASRLEALERVQAEMMAKLEELRPQVIENIRTIDRLEGDKNRAYD